MTTMTFATDIEQAADAPIEAVVIGPFGWSWSLDDTDAYGLTDDKNVPRDRLGTVLAWDEARPFLDYHYDRGYGAPGCHAVTVWTANRVLFVTQYDGSTSIDSVPRYPIDHVPTMPGG